MLKTSEECLDFLKEAREALAELSIAEDREKQLVQDEKRLGKALEAERRTVTDMISQTIKKRRDEITDTYDKEMDKAQEQLKRARSRREKAKNQGVKERISSETEELRLEMKEIKSAMKSLFKEKHVPRFCNSGLYYSLFFPKWPKEMLTALFFVLLFFLAVPCGIYFLIPDHTHLHLIVIYVLDILIVGGIYISISNRTKLKYMETLREGRKYLDDVRSNQKQIKKVIASIKKDRDDAQYHLEQFDDDIARLQQDLNEITAKKKEALNDFETVTKTILQDEIEHNHKEKLDELEQEHSHIQEELNRTLAELKEKRLHITNHYGTYLGKEYLDSFKLAELCMIVQNGEASNVSEAITVHQTKKETQKA